MVYGLRRCYSRELESISNIGLTLVDPTFILVGGSAQHPSVWFCVSSTLVSINEDLKSLDSHDASLLTFEYLDLL